MTDSEDQHSEHASPPEVIHIEDNETPGQSGTTRQQDGTDLDQSNRPQLRETRKRDYSYQEYENTIRNATEREQPQRKRRKCRPHGAQKPAVNTASHTSSIMVRISKQLLFSVSNWR